MPPLDAATTARATLEADSLVLQRLPLAPPLALRDLYVQPLRGGFPATIRAEGSGLLLAPRTAVSFDTYFGAFFEPAWRDGTRLRSLTLVLRVTGSLALRVLRRNAEGEAHLLHEQRLPRADGTIEVPLPAPSLPAAAGRLFAEVTALHRGCRIAALEWHSADTPRSDVGLVPIFCTFGREEQLAAALASLAAEPACWRTLPRLIVVNQGKAGLAAHPAMTALPEEFRARLTILEQGNLGGAGGFTRGLLAARNVPGATHALLMDDDVAVEPEALRRTVAWFAIAHPRQVLGGHMLDLLRPTQLYEAGARVDPATWRLQPMLHRQPLQQPWMR
jgi:galactofuranosylgalactofuranosylrhamnosyl-N-acetylglucosaminyl-diphospho-decaprenol beta-1,5/1,6-galactofuranosyltransferase